MNSVVVQADQAGASPRPAPVRTRIAVLGAGPAGTAAALALARDAGAEVQVIEQRDGVGGNAGSFVLDGVACDFGSHRFHPAADPRVMAEVKHLLGDDLLWRPRHGRILLQNRWIHFPLKPLDLVRRLPKSFVASLAFDALGKAVPRRRPVLDEETFASVLERGLGRTLSEGFYFPYVRKLWGLAPDQLAVTLARRRVSGSSIAKMLQKVARQIPGVGSRQAGGFYYPRQGFGQISQGLYQAAIAAGASFELGARVAEIRRDGPDVVGIRYEKDGRMHERHTDAVWSTLPVTLLVRMIRPEAPPEVLEAAGSIRFRGMILIYLVLEQTRFTEWDAHYFPELRVPISRLSEPKNYAAREEPRDRTVLCAELPSDPGEPPWSLSDDELGERLQGWLADVGLPVEAGVVKVVTRRLRFAYPVYDVGYERRFEVMDRWLGELDGLLTFGRQGLFAHDNTHHAMAMAFAASECVRPNGTFDRALWQKHRLAFEAHVVED